MKVVLFQDLQLLCCVKVYLIKDSRAIFENVGGILNSKEFCLFHGNFTLNLDLKAKICCHAINELNFAKTPSTKAIISQPIQI